MDQRNASPFSTQDAITHNRAGIINHCPPVGFEITNQELKTFHIMVID